MGDLHPAYVYITPNVNMTERSMKSTNPEFKEYNLLQTLLCWLKNPQCLFHRPEESANDMPELETQATIKILEGTQQEYIDTGVFADYINRALKVE